MTQPGAPPSKHVKSQRSTSGSQCLGSGVNNKYIKDDLPPGCTTDNVWKWLYISALAHFATGYNNPWSIPSKKFRATLQEIWDTVYAGNIEHVVMVGGPVYQIVRIYCMVVDVTNTNAPLYTTRWNKVSITGVEAFPQPLLLLSQHFLLAMLTLKILLNALSSQKQCSGRVGFFTVRTEV